MKPGAKQLLNETCDIWRHISLQLTSVFGQQIHISKTEKITGGDINTSFRVESNKSAGTHKDVFFVKLIDAKHAGMHTSEFNALNTLNNTQTMRVPIPLTVGIFENFSFLAMEYLPLSPQGDEFELGAKLALLHQCRNPDKHTPFGFDSPNFIGTTPQINQPHTDWSLFWSQNRLLPQIERALKSGYPQELQRKTLQLIEKLPGFFQNYTPEPSLLHGDLWGGNKGYVDNGPVLFDPASYYGDRETDIALTELFGGFSADFYRGYESVWKLDSGYPLRRPLYNLYHLLNHLNLFGTQYLGQCLRTLDTLLERKL